jgi:hypothetical protein
MACLTGIIVLNQLGGMTGSSVLLKVSGAVEGHGGNDMIGQVLLVSFPIHGTRRKYRLLAQQLRETPAYHD